MFHDTAVYHGDFGVWKFWDKLKKRFPHPHIEFSHGFGLGVLFTGAIYPLEIERLIGYVQSNAGNREAFAKACATAGRDLPHRLATPPQSRWGDAPPTLLDTLVMGKYAVAKNPPQANDLPAPRSEPQPTGLQPRRNEMCFCGSGRRYKHCHGRLV
jgi:hypothetical protein